MKTTTETAVPNLSGIVPLAAAHVYQLFKEKLPETILFHGYQHTVDVAEAADKLVRKSDLDKEAQALVMLAAWFHDTGFTETYEDHEEASIRIARAFLREHGLADRQADEVAALIRATRADHAARNLREQVIRDADVSHIGRKKFFERAERLRREWAHHRGVTYSDQEWAELQHDFLLNTTFQTSAAQKEYAERRAKNLKEVRRRLAETLDAEKPLPEGPGREAPSRGIETMFRTTYRNHINLSSIADTKANIMISINAILMSIIVSFISTRTAPGNLLLVPATLMLITSAIAIVFAILSARPKVTSQVFTLEDVRRNRSNLLFFGNFVKLPAEDYNTGMHEIMKDWDRLYDSMINDIYSLGQVLSKKYRLLWISYTVFMAGLVGSVILFLALFLT